VLPEYITEFRHVPENGQQKTLNMFYSDSANIEIRDILKKTHTAMNGRRFPNLVSLMLPSV
jgi:hypothetical protein